MRLNAQVTSPSSWWQVWSYCFICKWLHKMGCEQVIIISFTVIFTKNTVCCNLVFTDDSDLKLINVCNDFVYKVWSFTFTSRMCAVRLQAYGFVRTAVAEQERGESIWLVSSMCASSWWYYCPPCLIHQGLLELSVGQEGKSEGWFSLVFVLHL